MKLVVLVPSEAYKSYAGVRIRYKRIAPEMARLGIELTIQDIGHFDPMTAVCDGIIVSKCHDARSLVAPAVLSDRGKLVGVDLFDDYFSQAHDSRLSSFRNWLVQLLESCDFALCSTEALAEVVAVYRASLPTHVMNDPAPAESFDRIEAALERKLANARDRREIRVCWFGVGDNSYFPVGLSDLAAYAGVLPRLSRSGFDVRLKVVTNSRALGANGLSLISKLPVAAEVEEWSEERERAALEEALVCFLPVNAQPFSVAKSLNRTMTALASGCQVLSSGYPLYVRLEPLIYRDPDTLVQDLDRGSLRFSGAAKETYRHVIDECGSAPNEAKALASFLQALRLPVRSTTGPLCLIHGHSTGQEAHSFIRRVDGISVASPYCSAALDFDVVFRGDTSGLSMFVAKSASSKLNSQVRARAKPGGRINGLAYLQISGATGADVRGAEWRKAPIPFQLATYGESLELMKQALATAFGPCRTILSETSPLPFPREQGR